MLTSSSSPIAAPAAAPPTPNNAAPRIPNVMTGPTPGTKKLAAAAPRLMPLAAPMAPPTTPPSAVPTPGGSVSVVGTPVSSSVSSSSDDPGNSTIKCSSGIPSDLRYPAARHASSLDLKIPTTGSMTSPFSFRAPNQAYGSQD